MDTLWLCTDDNIFAISSFLIPRDLANWALMCKRFGGKSNVTSTSNKRRRHQSGGGWPWSIMEEASRRRVSAAKGDLNNPWRDSHLLTIRGEESWMAVDQRLHLLQSSLVFSRIIGSKLSYTNDGDLRHIIQGKRRESAGYSVAICQEVMKSGKHYAEFIVTNGGPIYIGVVRPIHNWPKKKIKHEEYREHCHRHQQEGDLGYEGNDHEFFSHDEREHYLNYLKTGDVIGVFLDVEEGIMTVDKKNGEQWRISTFEFESSRRGLVGHYCWAVKMNNSDSNRPSVRIRKVAGL